MHKESEEPLKSAERIKSIKRLSTLEVESLSVSPDMIFLLFICDMYTPAGCNVDHRRVVDREFKHVADFERCGQVFHVQ